MMPVAVPKTAKNITTSMQTVQKHYHNLPGSTETLLTTAFGDFWVPASLHAQVFDPKYGPPEAPPAEGGLVPSAGGTWDSRHPAGEERSGLRPNIRAP